MDYVLEFINLLIIPILSVGICMKRKLVEEKVISILCLYSWMCTLNILCAFIFLKIMQAMTGIAFAKYSEYYTVIAFIIAILMPYIVEIVLKCIRVDMNIKERH